MKKTNLFLLCLILFIGAQSSVISQSSIFIVGAFIISGIIFLSRNLKLDRFYIIFTLGYFILSIPYYFIFDYVDTLYVVYFYILLSYAYLTIKILKYDFFEIFHQVVYILAFISLPFFILQIINFDFTFSLVGLIQNSFSFLEFNNDVFANNLFFSMESDGAMFRNSGFAWEPKGFANFLILAIIINSILYDFKINKKMIILVIALITTFSTVGYIVLFTGFAGFLFINNKIKIYYVIIAFIVFLIVLISENDFIFDKVSNEIYTMQDQADMIYDKRFFESRSLGRFGSLLVDYNDFIKHPIFGYGIQRKDTSRIQLRTQAKYNYTKLVRVNGFSDRLVTFGLVGILFYIISLYKGFKRYLLYYNKKGAVFILFIFLMIEFATTLTTDPFWMMFLFLFLINEKRPNKLDIKNG